MRQIFLLLSLFLAATVQGQFVALIENERGDIELYDVDYQAILDYASGQGYTLPSDHQKGIQNLMVQGMKATGIWDAEDVIYLPANDGSEEFAGINWKDPNSYELIKVGTVNWIANYGFKGDGTTGAMNTQWLPNYMTTPQTQNFSDNSVSMQLHNNHHYVEEGSTSGAFYGNGQYSSSGIKMTYQQTGTSAMNIHMWNNSSNNLAKSDGTQPYSGWTNIVYDDSGAQPNNTVRYLNGNLTWFKGDDIVQGAYNQTSFPMYIGATNYDGGLGQAHTKAGWGYWSAGSKQTDKVTIKDDMIKAYFDSIINPVSTHDIRKGIALGVVKDMNESNMQDIFWHPDGMMYWILGATNDNIKEYTCDVPWRLEDSSLTYTFSVSTWETVPTTLYWHESGDFFFIGGLAGDDINRFDCTTAWDVSTATFTSKSGGINLGPYELHFEPSGTQVWLTESISSVWYINRYELTSAWDPTTLQLTENKSYVAGNQKASNWGWSADGKHGWMGSESNGYMQSYWFSTPYDWTTAMSDAVQRTVYTQNFRAGYTPPEQTEKFWVGGSGSNVEMKEYWYVAKMNLGPFINPNPGFDTDTGWSKNTGWSISNGQAIYDGTGGTSNLYQSNRVQVVDAEYLVSVYVYNNSGTGTNPISHGGVTVQSLHLPNYRSWYYVNKPTTRSSVFQIYGRSGEAMIIDDFGYQLMTDINTDYPSGDAMTPDVDANSIGTWFGASGNASVVTNTADAEDGTYCLEITNTYQDATAVRAEYDFNLEDGETYNITIWAKSISGAEQAFTAWIGFDNFSSKSINNTNWKQYKWEGLVANGTSQKIRAYPSSNSGNGLLGDKIVIDRMVIEKQ